MPSPIPRCQHIHSYYGEINYRVSERIGYTAATAVSSRPKILVIDDDPSHLKLYSLVLDRGGFDAVTALVNGGPPQLPVEQAIKVAVVDYRLGENIRAVQVIEQTKHAFPGVPVVVLSDMFWMPDDVSTLAAAFVRKGEPEKLLSTIGALVDGKQPDAQA